MGLADWINPAVRDYELGEGKLLVAGPKLFVLNPSAGALWDALRSGASVEEIRLASGAEGPVGPSTSAAVSETMASWEAEGLIGDVKVDFATADPLLQPLGPPPDWSAQWRCRLRERVLSFAVEDAEIARLLWHPFQHLIVKEAPAPALEIEVRGNAVDGWVLIANGRERLRGGDLRMLRNSVSLAMMEVVWPETSLTAYIHAGAVAKDGRSVSFPAPSGSGKTTLVAYLTAKGYTYLAEDVMPLDTGWNTLPWPLPMRVKSGSWQVLLPHYPALLEGPAFRVKGVDSRLVLPPADAWSARPAKLSAFIFPNYAAGATTEVQRLSPIDTMIGIAEAGIWPGYTTSDAHIRNLISGIEATDSYHVRYGSLADAEAVVADVLGAGRS